MRLDQLTAITFTERAAREMRQRIRSACLKRLKAAPDEHAGHWLRTLRDLDSARISTIHSFCGTLLRAHAVEARLDPHFQVLDASAAETILFELIDEQLRERLVQGDETVINLTVKFGLDRLRDMAGRLLDARQEIDWDYWRGETPGQLLARWENFWRTDTLPRVLTMVAKSAAAAAILELLGRETPTHTVMSGALRSCATACQSSAKPIIRRRHWRKYARRRACKAAEARRRGRARKRTRLFEQRPKSSAN